MSERPTIKGIFVKSHIRAVENLKGSAGIAELERRFGKSVSYKNSDDVLVSDEVALIEHALAIINPEASSATDFRFMAGRLHFKNFLTTPLAKIIFTTFRSDFKLMMLQSKNIAGHVFKGVIFTTEDLGERAVRVNMQNNDYPIEHFQGLFSEWMEFSGKKGSVYAEVIPPDRYVYTMEWA